ncbi:MAG: hypothetical protein DWB46_06725 [Leptolyngbya sp.]|nr:hypothetical protein [Leptolyngbya sp.]MCZ7632515.1 dockerin type I domain-containing protein [Phycisphaerales bacterium]
MTQCAAAVCGTFTLAVCSLAGENVPLPHPPVSTNLHRVRVLLDGDARAVWIGDSWCRLHHISRLPYGALCTWRFEDVTAVCLAHRPGGGLGRAFNYTDGTGSLEEVNHSTGWTVEVKNGTPAFFALPLNDMTRVYGDPSLLLTGTGVNTDWIQALGVNNSRFAQTDSGPFARPGDRFHGRLLYYTPADPLDMTPVVVLADSAGAVRGSIDLRHAARPKWIQDADPESDPAAAATPSQINAARIDVLLEQDVSTGPRLAILQDPALPIAGSSEYWFFAGAVFYRIGQDSARVPGYYHSGLAQDSWSFNGHAKDEASNGGGGPTGKTFSDEQLLHWLDVTTLDRSQTPVVIIHMATEGKDREVIDASVRGILARYRTAFAAIGTAPPRFLLVGSYMHRVGNRPPEESRPFIEDLDAIYESLASSEPDCAFFSLYRATDGVYFTTDSWGGPGAQQQARDWLDANGWSTITFGGQTYNLSSTENGGLDGVMTADGLHLSSTPAAAFYAKLIGDALAASFCPADFNQDGSVNTLDLLAFLNAWTANDPNGDFNGDGTWNTLDVLAFLNAYNAPCP